MWAAFVARASAGDGSEIAQLHNVVGPPVCIALNAETAERDDERDHV